MKNAHGNEVMAEKVRGKLLWMVDDLRKDNLFLKQQNEAYERKFQVLETKFSNAELVRLNSELGLHQSLKSRCIQINAGVTRS